MLVYAGASNVLNFGLPAGTLGCAELIADSLGMNLHKIASPGASNYFLIRSVKEFIKTNHPTLLIITWQSWEREEWLHNGIYHQINSSGLHNLPEELSFQYKNWVIEQQSMDIVKTKGLDWHQRIWILHELLQELQIPHVFYNEMYPFVLPNSQQKNWDTSFIGPYENNLSYYWYLRTMGYTSDNYYHFGADGHRAWADHLIRHIQEHNLA